MNCLWISILRLIYCAYSTMWGSYSVILSSFWHQPSQTPSSCYSRSWVTSFKRSGNGIEYDYLCIPYIMKGWRCSFIIFQSKSEKNIRVPPLFFIHKLKKNLYYMVKSFFLQNSNLLYSSLLLKCLQFYLKTTL